MRLDFYSLNVTYPSFSRQKALWAGGGGVQGLIGQIDVSMTTVALDNEGCSGCCGKMPCAMQQCVAHTLIHLTDHSTYSEISKT